MMEYNDTPTFDLAPEDSWDAIVNQATPILREKFRLAGQSAGMFLDIGCSEGIYLAAAECLGWQAIGIEVDQPKFLRAKARGLDVRSVDLSNPGDALPKCDFILLRHVLEHVPDFVALLQNVSRLLALNGVICVECPNQACLSALLNRRRLKDGRFLGELYPPTHIHAFEPSAFKKLGIFAGMKCIKSLTYSRSNRNWFLPSQYNGSWLKSATQRLTAQIGYGGNLAAFYIRESSVATE